MGEKASGGKIDGTKTNSQSISTRRVLYKMGEKERDIDKCEKE